jgi:general stress protein YciG
MSTTGCKRGFAALPPDRLREISRKGGVTAHASGRAYRWTSEQAREAGRKGGISNAARRRHDTPA